MSAIRVARGSTGRDLLLKFDGCYHGHADSLLVKAGSGVATLGIPDSTGVPAAAGRADPHGGLQRPGGGARCSSASAATASPRSSSSRWPATWAWCRRPRDFSQGLREVTREHGALLIFDEVITGFRVAYGGAQARYGVRARPHVPGQDHRRRPAGRRLRRPPRDHGANGAARGPSTRRARCRAIRWRSPPASPRSRAHRRPRLRAAGSARRPARAAGLARRAQGRRAAHGQSRGLDAHRASSARVPWWTTPAHGAPTRRASRASSRRCSSGACIWRPRSSRRPSSRWRTPRPTWMRPDARRRRRSRPSREVGCR